MFMQLIVATTILLFVVIAVDDFYFAHKMERRDR